MKKNLIVSKIEASPDGSYIYVTFSDPIKYGQGDQDRINPSSRDYSSMEDLMGKMPKVITNLPTLLGNFQPDRTTLKMSMKEYEDFGVKIGDCISFSIEKSEPSGV